MICFRSVFYIFVFVLTAFFAEGQTRVTLRGVVLDLETGESLPFATVLLKSHAAGTRTDSLGHFSFCATSMAGDSLQVSYVGYATKSLVITSQPEQAFQIALRAAAGTIGEVVIIADPDPGKSLMKKVLARNKQNDPARFGRLDARRWSRSEVAIFDPRLATDSTGKLAADQRGLFASRVRTFEQYRPAEDTLQGETPLFFAERLVDYSLAIIDTIVQHVPVLQYDTIYKTVIMRTQANYSAGQYDQGENNTSKEYAGQALVIEKQPNLVSNSLNKGIRSDIATPTSSIKMARGVYQQKVRMPVPNSVTETSDSLINKHLEQAQAGQVETRASTQ